MEPERGRMRALVVIFKGGFDKKVTPTKVLLETLTLSLV